MTISNSNNQEQIFKELFLAQNKGYILDIQAIRKLDEDVQICYTPNELKVLDKKVPPAVIQCPYANSSEKMPSVSQIYVKFSNRVSAQMIEKVSEYFRNKYSCKYTVYPNRRMDLYSFK